VTESFSKYFDVIGNDKNEIHSIEMVSDEAVGITYSSKDEFVVEGSSFNLFLSIFTTSAARLKLYEIMRAVADAEGCKLLYTVSTACFWSGYLALACFRTQTRFSSSTTSPSPSLSKQDPFSAS